MKNQKTKQQSQKNQAKKLKTQRLQPQTFGGHIAELRKRLFLAGLLFLTGSILAYSYRQELLDIIMAPLNGQQLVYLTPGGGFSFIFQVSIWAGLIMTAPVFVYQLHAFIRPALPTRAQKLTTRITLLATALIIGGVSYAYFVAIPAAMQFLNTFAEGAVTPNLTADSYLSFFLTYVGGLALLSLIPLVVMFWHWINPLTPGGVIKGEQWVVLLAFVLAAIITPTPDVLNQVMIAVPIIIIYQIGAVAVIVSILRDKRRNKRFAVPSVEPVQTEEVAVQNTLPPTFAHASPAQAMETPVTAQPIHRPMPTLRRSIDGFNTGQRSAPSVLPRMRPERPVERPVQPRMRSSGHLSLNGLVKG